MSSLWYTPGPASAGIEQNIIAAGATGARLTFSYSTPAYQEEQAKLHRQLARAQSDSFLIVADLAGEKFRLGEFCGASSIAIHEGERYDIEYGAKSDPSAKMRTFAVNSHTFFSNLHVGDHITVGDGNAVLRVIDVSVDAAKVIVDDGGVVNQARGLTVDGAGFVPQCLTAKDISDLEFIAQSDAFDAVALSFVSEASHIEGARQILERGIRRIPIIAKIETQLGVANIAEICDTADMLMAARGDLALAMPWVELPAAVERIQLAADASGKPWILATQIVEGLERFALPTRAEICDLAHWMACGCSGVLVSYETAFGANPVGAVRAARLLLDRWNG